VSTIIPNNKLLSAKELAAILDFRGKRPERAVYEMVADGRIPREYVVRLSTRSIRFHPARIQNLLTGAASSRLGPRNL
jgi:predicted DNA-binding transcriptional regulator AlpA